LASIKCPSEHIASYATMADDYEEEQSPRTSLEAGTFNDSNY